MAHNAVAYMARRSLGRRFCLFKHILRYTMFAYFLCGGDTRNQVTVIAPAFRTHEWVSARRVLQQNFFNTAALADYTFHIQIRKPEKTGDGIRDIRLIMCMHAGAPCAFNQHGFKGGWKKGKLAFTKIQMLC
uniref:Uncharacterized protein n=1 Tax=termite gut metagenome TaxID=433724 RepID=S0DDE8_9ZZZZ